MAIQPFYVPWWLYRTPFDIEEDEIVLPDNLLTYDELATKIEKNRPDLWDKAAQYPVHLFQERVDKTTGETIIEFPYEWSEEMKASLQIPAHRAEYLLEKYEPLAPLRERSAGDNLNISLAEKWKYSVEHPLEEGVAIGLPSLPAVGTRLMKEGLWALESFSDHLQESFDRNFGDDELIAPFSSPEEKELYKNEYTERIKAINEEKKKEYPDKETFKLLDDANEFFESIVIRNIKASNKRKEKDLRYQAFSEYASNKPVSWLTTFKSPEYFTDTVFGMIPSAGTMAASVGAYFVGGPPAAIAATMAGFMPLEATGTYTEAYNWTMEETGDEELARSNAAWATAEYLTVVGATEGWGAMRLLKAFLPKAIGKSAKNGLFRKFYKDNIATDERVSLLKGMKDSFPGKVSGYAYDAFKLPFGEGLQEYVQYAGNILAESGYKDESQNLISILATPFPGLNKQLSKIPFVESLTGLTFEDHPLVDHAEVHESVVGGSLFGGAFGLAGYAGKKMGWNDSSNKANMILNDEYGVNTGVPNADLSEESLMDVPTILGDSPPTISNYIKELMSPSTGQPVAVSRKKAEGTPLGNLIKNHNTYHPSALTEKLAEAIQLAGKDSWDELDPSLKSEVNQHLKGSVVNLDKKGWGDILPALDNPDNIAKDILDGKLVFESKRVGTAFHSTKDRKIKIKDRGYADSIIEMYESEISESLGEDVTATATKNFLAREQNIEIDKSLKKEIGASVQKHVEGGISEVFQREAEQEAEKEFERQIEAEALKALKKKQGIKDLPTKGKPSVPKVVGQRAAILEGKHKGKSGKITVFDEKKGLLKIKLDDGTRIGPIKKDDIALMDMLTAPAKPTAPKITSIIKEAFKLPKGEQSRGFGNVSDSNMVNYLSTAPVDVVKKVLNTLPKNRKEKLSDVISQYRKIIKSDLSPLSQMEKLNKIEKFIPTSDAKVEFFKEFNEGIVKPTAPAKPTLAERADVLKDLLEELKSEKDVLAEPSKVKVPKKKKPSAKQELKQKVNKVLDIKADYDSLSSAIELKRVSGRDISKKELSSLASLKSKLSTAYNDIAIREALSKRGVLKAIERLIITDETPQQKKFHKIGDAYERGEKKATKAFIAKALDEIMGGHAPDIQKTLKREIKEDPNAVGTYSEGMVEFVLGKATKHTAYHEPIHWFMNRILNDGDYESVIDHFGNEEAATRAAADWYMGQKDRTLTEKIRDIFRRFWIAVQKFFNRQVNAEDTIFDIFSRIGRDFTIRNFKDRMDEYDIGVDVEFDGVDELMILPSMSETSFDEMLERLYKIPVSEYNPRQRTLMNETFILHNPSQYGKYSALSTSQIPASDHSRISLPYEYNFSNNLAQTKTEKISLGSQFSTKGLSKYEAAVVKSFYKNAINAEWTEGKKSVDKQTLIAEYESYIEKEFPLNAYAVRFRPENINKHGVVAPALFDKLVPNATKYIANDFFSSRIMLTDQDFYDGFGHKFQLDPSSSMKKSDLDEKALSEIGAYSPEFNGLGWYVYVEPRIKNKKELEGLALVYEFQQDIHTVIEEMDNTGDEDIAYGLLPEFVSQITSGISTPEEAARNQLIYKATLFASKRMRMEASHRGDEKIVSFHVDFGRRGQLDVNNGFKLTQITHSLRHYKGIREDIKDRISELDREINQGIRNGIVNRMMQKIEYNETVNWNKLLKSVSKKPEKEKYAHISKYIEKRFTSIILALTPINRPATLFEHRGSYTNTPYRINPKTGNVEGVKSISSILNTIGVSKEGKKYILGTLKSQEQFDNVVGTLEKSVPHPTGFGGIMETYNILDLEGIDLMLRDAMYHFFMALGDTFRSNLQSFGNLAKGRGLLPALDGYAFEAEINKAFGKIISKRKKDKIKTEVGNKKRNQLKRRLQYKIDNVLTDDVVLRQRIKKIAARYVDKYNRQVKGLVNKLQNKVDTYVENLENLKSLSAEDLDKTQKLRHEQNRFKEISIHHSILTAHERGNRTWALAGAEAHLKLEGSTNIDTAKLYLNEFELYDSKRVKTYEEWNIKSLGQTQPTHMAFVDAYFGLGRGNHLKSDEQITEELEKWRTRVSPYHTSYGIRVVFEDNKWYSYKGYSDKNKIEITYEEAKNYYIDAPKLGPVWTTARKVLRKLGLKAEYKNYSALKAPVAIVRLPDNEIEMAPVKRFHKIEEEPEFEKKESEAEELARKSGLKEKSTVVNDTVIEDALNLSRASQRYNAPLRAAEFFDVSFYKIRDKYGIEVSDYVPAMHKALRVIADREQRDMVKNWLSEWAVKLDPEVATKMRSNNESVRIIELMGYPGRKARRIQRQIADLGVVDNIINTLDASGAEDSHDLSREGLEISDVSDPEEISNDMTFEAYDFAGDRFFKFLESTSAKGFLDPKQTAELMEEVSVKNYDEFLEYMESKYKYSPETVSDTNMIRSFWVRNQMINRQPALDKPAWWWANMTYDGRVLKNKNDKRFIPKVGGHPKYGKDIRNNQDLPRTSNVSFFDWDNKSYEWASGDIKYSRLYLKDIIDIHQGEEKGGFYSTPTFLDLSGKMVRNWDTKLAQYADSEIGDGLVRTIVGVKSGGNHPSFIIARASKDIMDIASDAESLVEYLDYEVSTGNINEEMKKDMVNSMLNEMEDSKLNNHIQAQHILMHEVLKRALGRDYLMRTPDAVHHSRRLAIPDGDGVVAVGTGDFTIKIIDQSKLFVSSGMPGARGSSAKIPMTSYIAGLSDKYHGDGSLWVESEYLDKTADAVGRTPNSPNSSRLREIKSRIRFISKNDEFGNKHYKQEVIRGEERTLATEEQIEGTHYLAMKHNEFVPEEDVYITDENDNVVVYTANENGRIRIYDGDENRVTMFGTLDEAKEPDGGSGVFKLNGRNSTDILTLPEESRRIVKIPKQQGHSSAAFPWSWMSHLHSPSFDGLRDALTTRMLNVARGNMNTLFATRGNPEVMRALMGQFKSDGLSIMNEVDRLIEPIPGQMISDGFMHPHLITGVVEPVKNRMLKENSYGGRRRGFGSYPVIKSDLTRTIVKNKDGVVVSADDVTMMRFLKDMLNVSGFGNELIENVNEALKSRREYLMVGRWPTYTLSSVFLARIEKVMPKGHGGVTWFHPESIVGKLQADHDGDNSFLIAPYFGMNYADRTVINSMKSKEVKEAFENLESFVRLEYFAKEEKQYKMTNKADMYIISGKLGIGINSQGILMNAVNFMEDMYFKGFKAEIGGQTVVVRNPDEESVVMQFAKLNEDVTQEMLNDAKMGTMVDKDGNKWESGDKYLKTTPLKQLHVLLQAAVDNAQEFLLADWGFSGYLFLMPKIFVQENGSPIGSKQASSIASLIRKELMNNLARRGVSSKDNRSQSMSDMFETSKDMYEMNNMSGVERGQRIKEKANTRRLRYGDQSELANDTHEIDKIIFNNRLTPMERLIAVPHESLVEYESSNPNDTVYEHPMGYHPNRIVRGIMQTQKDMYTIQRETERWYPETKAFSKDKELARRLVNEMTREFYKIMMSAKMYKDSTKSRITSSGYPYQEKLVEFIDKWLNKGDKKKSLPSYSSLSEQQQAYATLRFLRGILRFSPQTQKKVGKREERIARAIMDTREKLSVETDSDKVTNLQKNLEKLEKRLDGVYEVGTYLNLSRARDIEKLLPMPLMHPGVWTEFANRFGPNLREASSKKVSLKTDSRYEERNDKTIEQLLRNCK